MVGGESLHGRRHRSSCAEFRPVVIGERQRSHDQLDARHRQHRSRRISAEDRRPGVFGERHVIHRGARGRRVQLYAPGVRRLRQSQRADDAAEFPDRRRRISGFRGPSERLHLRQKLHDLLETRRGQRRRRRIRGHRQRRHLSNRAGDFVHAVRPGRRRLQLSGHGPRRGGQCRIDRTPELHAGGGRAGPLFPEALRRTLRRQSRRFVRKLPASAGMVHARRGFFRAQREDLRGGRARQDGRQSLREERCAEFQKTAAARRCLFDSGRQLRQGEEFRRLLA